MPLSDSWIDFVAGWWSGATAVLACQPMDTILTRYQAGLGGIPESGNSNGQAHASCSATRVVVGGRKVASSTQGESVLSWLRRSSIAKALTRPATTGWRALWHGSYPMIGSVPMQNALLMGGYGLGQRHSETYAPHHRLTAIFVGGCTGGILQSFLMSPVELMKVSQQCSGTSIMVASKDVVWNIHHSSSIAWRGLGATLLRDGIPHGVWFVTYEVTKQQLQVIQNGDDELLIDPLVPKRSRVWIPLISGAVAATVAWIVGYPADLIKTRIQSSSTSKPSLHRGICETARILIQEANGRVLAGLYKGFGLKLLRAIPASMIGFTTYEMMKSNLERFSH